MSQRRVCLFGGGLDTGNRGVEALTCSVIHGLKQRDPEVSIAVFDHSRGCGNAVVSIGGHDVTIERYGARWSRRLYARDSLANIRWSAWCGGLGNRASRAILESTAILDISGGDSFTDLYGKWRYRQVLVPKNLAIALGKPLVLLPQTYGPFKEGWAGDAARRVLERAAMVWARDRRSLKIAEHFGAGHRAGARLTLGVDVAFGLPVQRPDHSIIEVFDRGELVGVNVSGLIYNDSDRARSDFGFRADYAIAIQALIQQLVEDEQRTVVLVPHVATPRGHFESDLAACEHVRECLRPSLRERVLISPDTLTCCEAKWLIAQCDWFCGTRMHATIAGLSSGTPTAAVAYSDKTRGVFETCGQGGEVVDPREVDTDEVVERLMDSYRRRETVGRSLADHLPRVLAQASQQMDEIARFCIRAQENPAGRSRPRVLAQAAP